MAIFGMFLVVVCANCRADQVHNKKSNQKPAAPVSPVTLQHPNPAAPEAKDQQDIHADVKIVNPPQKDFYDKAPVWINLALVVAAILTLLAIAKQTYHTRRAAQATELAVKASDKAYTLAEKTARQQLRAYFGVPEGKLCIFDDGDVEARLTFRNCGQTPAYQLEIETCGRFESSGVQYSPPRRDPNLRSHPHILGAGSPYHFTCNKVQSGMGKTDLLNDLVLSRIAFRLYGKCTYKDAFRDTHFIEFQLVVGGGAIVQYTADPDKRSLVMLTDYEGNNAD